MNNAHKMINCSKLALNCIIYSLTGIFYDLWLALVIIIVEQLAGKELTDPLRVVCIVLITILGAIPASILISKFRTWLFSLPLQYILYLVVLAMADIGDLTTLWTSDVSLYYHLQVSLALVLHQIPGVAIGLLIRYLIRKVKARKQPIPAV
jgi:hypothetical protein